MNSLMQYSPLAPFGTLRREIDRVFDQLGDTQSGAETRGLLWSPRADLSETEESYLIRMDVPGLQKENLNVELHEGMLHVKGERKAEHEEKRENFHRVERSYGHFYRSFSLPQAGNPDDVQANLRDGVLTITVAKREESKPRRIEIA